MYKTEGLGLIPCPYEKPGKMMYIYNPRAREADSRTPSLLATQKLQVHWEPTSQQMKVE